MSFPVVKRYEFAGLPIAVEHPAGSIRLWDAGGGKQGSTRMLLDYGYVEGWLSGDGEELDVYVGPDPEARFVHVIDQLKAPDFRAHDEDKVMLGFSSADHALAAYLHHRDDGERAFAAMTTLPLERFKTKLRRRGSEATTKIRASQDLARRGLMALAGRKPRAIRRTAAGRARAARYEARLVERSVAAAAEALGDDLKDLAAEIQAAESFADLERRILRTYAGRMDPSKLGEVIRRTRMLARLSGRAAAADEV